MMRDITGVGKGKGPFIAFHDGFSSLAAPVAAGGWNGFLNGWDRVAIDSHRYLCFADPNNWGLGYQATLVSSVPSLPFDGGCLVTTTRLTLSMFDPVAVQLLGRTAQQLDERFRSHPRRRVVPCECVCYPLPSRASASSRTES